ncbi:hypothetical protein [Nocardia sp. NPDC060249]
MSHLTPPTPAPRPPLADLVTTLEAMREAGRARTDTTRGDRPARATRPAR